MWCHMVSENIVDSVLRQLQVHKNKLRCNEVQDLLEQLGFVVRDGARGGHKVFVHPQLEGFYSGSYNCGHGRNPEIKVAYISNVIRIINLYREALIGNFEHGGIYDKRS